MKKLGFTLSEVLMTLAILGVVAAILIPFISQTKKNHEYKTGYKKAISTTNQALKQHYALEGLTVQDYFSAEDLVNGLFKERMNTIDGSSVFTNSECASYGDNAVFTTADGIIFCVSNFAIDPNNHINSTCDMYDKHPCTDIDGPNLWIDVNGERSPNRPTISANHPKDIFQAQIYAHKIVPYGNAETKIILGNDDKSTNSDNKNTGNNQSTSNQGGSNNNTNLDKNDSPYEDNYIPENNPNEGYGDEETGNSSGDEDNKNENTQGNNDQNDDNNNEQPEQEEDLDNEDIGGEEVDPNTMPDPDNPYYDQWDPKKWPNWLEFLKWLLGKIAGALG